MNEPASTSSTDRSAQYLNEVLLQPDQVDDVALTTPEAGSVPGDDDQHPHGDY
jgi:hypothetical protein